MAYSPDSSKSRGLKSKSHNWRMIFFSSASPKISDSVDVFKEMHGKSRQIFGLEFLLKRAGLQAKNLSVKKSCGDKK